jgi:hypothetical protein
VTATTIADRIIIALAILFIIWLYQHYWIKPDKANYALISIANQDTIKINLHKDQKLNIQGAIGKSIIEISKGRIRFLTSPCHNQQCVHTGWLTHGREIVVCLPNQITIQMQENDEYDAIVW